MVFFASNSIRFAPNFGKKERLESAIKLISDPNISNPAQVGETRTSPSFKPGFVLYASVKAFNFMTNF